MTTIFLLLSIFFLGKMKLTIIFMQQIERVTNLNNYCKDSIRDGPKIVVGPHVMGPNNIICRAWV